MYGCHLMGVYMQQVIDLVYIIEVKKLQTMNIEWQ